MLQSTYSFTSLVPSSFVVFVNLIDPLLLQNIEHVYSELRRLTKTAKTYVATASHLDETGFSLGDQLQEFGWAKDEKGPNFDIPILT